MRVLTTIKLLAWWEYVCVFQNRGCTENVVH